MFLSLETLAAIATIIGTIVSVLALIQSRAWLMLTSLLIVVLGIGAVLYARRERMARESATTVIEGLSIDTLNLTNLRRKPDRKVFVQTAEHKARISGSRLEMEWRYSGFTRAEKVSSFEFTLETGPISLQEIGCVAFDTIHDPHLHHPITPLLTGPEGISKLISVPLLETIDRNQPFGVVLRCALPDCITPGLNYYSSTLSFLQKSIQHCRVRLEFEGAPPDWIRVYECRIGRSPRMVKALTPRRVGRAGCEFEEVIEDIPARSARVYLFRRGQSGDRRGG